MKEKGVEKNVLRREPVFNEALPDSKSVMARGILKAGCGLAEPGERVG